MTRAGQETQDSLPARRDAECVKIHRRSFLVILQAKMCHPPTGNDESIDLYACKEQGDYVPISPAAPTVPLDLW